MLTVVESSALFKQIFRLALLAQDDKEIVQEWQESDGQDGKGMPEKMP